MATLYREKQPNKAYYYRIDWIILLVCSDLTCRIYILLYITWVLDLDLTGTFSLKSYSESIASSKRSSRRSRHYGKTSTKSSERKSSTKSTRQKSAESSKQSEHTDKKGRKKSLTKNVHKKSLGRISETKSPPTKQN